MKASLATAQRDRLQFAVQLGLGWLKIESVNSSCLTPASKGLGETRARPEPACPHSLESLRDTVPEKTQIWGSFRIKGLLGCIPGSL